jgi:predicted  nucleic acid-binding Zn-ribbon protein
MAGKTFKSIQEELAHYKERAATLEETLADTQATLEDFQQSSKELEEELERELEQSERRFRDLKTKNEVLKNEVDEWKVIRAFSLFIYHPFNITLSLPLYSTSFTAKILSNEI